MTSQSLIYSKVKKIWEVSQGKYDQNSLYEILRELILEGTYENAHCPIFGNISKNHTSKIHQLIGSGIPKLHLGFNFHSFNCKYYITRNFIMNNMLIKRSIENT